MTQPLLLQPDKTIVLVGLMGCGKTAIGRRLAKKLGLPFVDLDQAIEEAAGMSVTDIFAKQGEQYFRQLELEAAKRLMNGKQSVLATGGGAFINDEIRALVKDRGISVWINADLETLLERVSKKNTRPLLEKGNKEEILKELIDKRYPIYSQADITVPTSHGMHEVVLRRIMEEIARI